MDTSIPRAQLERFTSDLTARVRACDTADELCEMVCELSAQLLPGSPIIVSLRDEEEDAITIRAFHGFDDRLDSALRVIGLDPRGVSFASTDMPPESIPAYCTGRLEHIPEGFYELICHKVPLAACRAAEALLGVRGVYVVGFGMDGRPHGGLIILDRGGNVETMRPLLELLAGMVSLAIRQRRADARSTRLEQRLHQARKMEAIGQLAGGVAHDFNNTLQVILGLTETMQLDLADGHPHLAPLDDLRAAALHARDTTRSLLAIGRRQRLVQAPVELCELVGEVQRLLSRTLRDDIRLHTTCATEPVWVVGDPNELQRALVNLAVNAQDALPLGGDITLSAGFDGDQALLQVRDTGVGMPPDVLAQAFEPFFTTKSADLGSGLGLATVYGTVTQHGGTIRVDSIVNQGTTFTITLPRTAASASRDANAEPSLPAHASPRGWMLLVDDEAGVRATVRRQLEALGWEVVEASSGDEALERQTARCSKPALVLTDVIMPGISGPELIQALRGRHPDLPAVTMSGYDQGFAHPSSPRTRHLAKPFSTRELEGVFAELLEEA